MAEVHQLIIRHGIEEARRQAVTKHERMVIEAAYQVLSDDAERMGFTYSGFALTSLPHKPQQSTTWRREGHNLTLVLQAGVDRNEKSLGVPVLFFFFYRARRSAPGRVRWSSADRCGFGWDRRWGCRLAA